MEHEQPNRARGYAERLTRSSVIPALCRDPPGSQAMVKKFNPYPARLGGSRHKAGMTLVLTDQRPQPALIVALADRHAPHAQDVVGSDGVEMEIG